MLPLEVLLELLIKSPPILEILYLESKVFRTNLGHLLLWSWLELTDAVVRLPLLVDLLLELGLAHGAAQK